MNLKRLTALLMLSSAPMFAMSQSFTVVELPTQDISENQFATSIDNTGLILTTVNAPYNRPIDMDLIDLDTLTLLDPDGALQGNFNLLDYLGLVAYVEAQTQANDFFSQKLANYVFYKVEGDTASYVNGLDEFNEDLDSFTFAQEVQHGDSVNGSHIVGTMSGPFYKLDYITEDSESLTYVINDVTSRAFVQVGNEVSELPAEVSEVGAISNATAINDSLQVSGLTAVSFTDNLQANIDICRDEELRGDAPEEVCLYTLRTESFSIFNSSQNTRAVVWQLDNSGEVVDTTVYGLLFEPSNGDTNVYSSQALDINNDGTAVGISDVLTSTEVQIAAVAFENGQIIRLLEDEDLLPNYALSINDNNIVVGYYLDVINNVTRARLFVLNRNNGDLDLPEGFFLSSSTIPRAINNNNIVVGEAESESSGTTRRRSGFMYSIDTKEFVDLNDLLDCDSPYTIVGANDINDNNEIVANAILERQQSLDSGDLLTNSDGEEVLVETVVAVKLEPTGLEAPECDLSEEELALERQGASFGELSALFLCVIIYFRRRKMLK